MAASPPSPGPPEPARGPLPHEKCPHCGSVAIVEPSSALRFQCGVCGRARVPVDDPAVPRSGAELASLKTATAARDAARAWAVGAALASAFALLSLVVLVLVVVASSPPAAPAFAGFLAAAVPLVLAAFGARRAREKRSEIGPALDQAYRTVAREVVEALGKAQPDDLASRMRMSTDEAEKLLIYLSVEGAVHSAPGDAASLEFEAERPRVRVAEAPGPSKAEPAIDEKAGGEGEAAARGEAGGEGLADEVGDDEAAALEQAEQRALEAKR